MVTLIQHGLDQIGRMHPVAAEQIKDKNSVTRYSRPCDRFIAQILQEPCQIIVLFDLRDDQIHILCGRLDA